MDIDDITVPGYVNQWSIVDGKPRCVVNPIEDTNENVISVLQKNQAIRSYYNDMEVYMNEYQNSEEPNNIVNNTPASVVSLYKYYNGNTDPVIVSTVEAEVNVRSQLPLETDPRPVPPVIPMWRAKVVLQKSGLLDTANGIVDQKNDPVLTSFWEYAPEIYRNSPTLKQMAVTIGLSETQLDDLFRQANSFTI
jgi:hypothetical protein